MPITRVKRLLLIIDFVSKNEDNYVLMISFINWIMGVRLFGRLLIQMTHFIPKFSINILPYI